MLIQKTQPLYAPEGEETGSATPQGEAPAAEQLPEPKSKEEKAPEASVDLEIEGLEKVDDEYVYTIGGSVYKGATLKEVMSNALKGAEEKAKASLELDRTVRELKAKRVIQAPEKDEEEEEIVPPSEQSILASVFQGSGLEPRMISWSDEQWLAYGEEKGWRDFQVGRAMDRVRDLAKEGTAKMNAATATWLNRTTLHDEITPTVQEMVAESGLEPEQFGDIYLQILQDKQYRGSDGLLKGSKIIKAMHKHIMAAIEKTPAREAAVVKKAAEEKAKLEEKKKSLGSGSSAVKANVSDKSPPNINEASRRALALLR